MFTENCVHPGLETIPAQATIHTFLHTRALFRAKCQNPLAEVAGIHHCFEMPKLSLNVDSFKRSGLNTVGQT